MHLCSKFWYPPPKGQMLKLKTTQGIWMGWKEECWSGFKTECFKMCCVHAGFIQISVSRLQGWYLVSWCDSTLSNGWKIPICWRSWTVNSLCLNMSIIDTKLSCPRFCLLKYFCHGRNIKDIIKLCGSEDLWEVAKLHDRESSFPGVCIIDNHFVHYIFS